LEQSTFRESLREQRKENVFKVIQLLKYGLCKVNAIKYNKYGIFVRIKSEMHLKETIIKIYWKKFEILLS